MFAVLVKVYTAFKMIHPFFVCIAPICLHYLYPYWPPSFPQIISIIWQYSTRLPCKDGVEGNGKVFIDCFQKYFRHTVYTRVLSDSM